MSPVQGLHGDQQDGEQPGWWTALYLAVVDQKGVVGAVQAELAIGNAVGNTAARGSLVVIWSDRVPACRGSGMCRQVSKCTGVSIAMYTETDRQLTRRDCRN